MFRFSLCNGVPLPIPVAALSWPLGCSDRGFESRWGHGCVALWLYVVFSCVGRGLCDGLITRTKESYQVYKIDYETSRVRRPRSLQGL
jgi:hypothetical protein